MGQRKVNMKDTAPQPAPFDYLAEAVDPSRNVAFTVVVHLDSKGNVYSAHTPMREDDIKCRICEAGARVYL